MDSSDASMANGTPGGPGGVACMAVLNVQTSSVTSDIKEKMREPPIKERGSERRGGY